MPISDGREYFTGNHYLNDDEMKINAEWFYRFMRKGNEKWSVNAIAAMLGNFERESTINPGIWHNLDTSSQLNAYGLAQWRPSTKFTNWCQFEGLSVTDIKSACLRLNYEERNNIQWSTSEEYPINFASFKRNESKTPYWLAGAFSYNYERPANPEPEIRGQLAEKWYRFIKTLEKPKKNLIMYYAKPVLLRRVIR